VQHQGTVFRDLTGRRGRARLGRPGGDAVLPTDPLEQHLGRSAGPRRCDHLPDL